MSHILIHDPGRPGEEWQRLLVESGGEIVTCGDRTSFVNGFADTRPDVLIYVLADLERDLDLLFELRSVAPTLPIILLDGPADLAARRPIQDLKPIYYGVAPLETHEVSEVVSGVLNRAGKRSSPDCIPSRDRPGGRRAS